MCFNSLKERHSPFSVYEKAVEFNNSNQRREIVGKKVEFEKSLFQNGEYVSNPSVPIFYRNEQIMAVRRCLNEEGDKISFVRKSDNEIWKRCENLPELTLQDPFLTRIHGKYILGGVKAWRVEQNKWTWVTEFYSGETLENMHHLVTGPTLMKDIRFAEAEGDKVGIFTRPQGILYRYYSDHIADIGYVEADCPEVADARLMTNAKILQGVFRSDEWGGVNQVYKLNNGLYGIIGHIAYGDGEFREGLTIHYYGAAFAFDPKTGYFTEPKIIISRECFPDQDESRCNDVIFSGGIVRKDGGKATFYGGVGDKFIGEAEIEDPFTEYELL